MKEVESMYDTNTQVQKQLEFLLNTCVLVTKLSGTVKVHYTYEELIVPVLLHRMESSLLVQGMSRE